MSLQSLFAIYGELLSTIMFYERIFCFPVISFFYYLYICVNLTYIAKYKRTSLNMSIDMR